MLIVSSMQKNRATVSDWLQHEWATDEGISPPSTTDFYEPPFVTALKYKLTNRGILGEASDAGWHWFLYGRTLLYTATSGEELWTAASSLCRESLPQSRDAVRVWALNISPQGVIHSRRATNDVSTANISDFLSSNVKQRCHFPFNMPRSLNGMRNGALIKQPSLTFLMCVLSSS